MTNLSTPHTSFAVSRCFTCAHTQTSPHYSPRCIIASSSVASCMMAHRYSALASYPTIDRHVSPPPRILVTKLEHTSQSLSFNMVHLVLHFQPMHTTPVYPIVASKLCFSVHSAETLCTPRGFCSCVARFPLHTHAAAYDTTRPCDVYGRRGERFP